jgi:hypothetical protein
VDTSLVEAFLLHSRSYNHGLDHFIVATQRSMYNTKQEGRWAFQIHVNFHDVAHNHLFALRHLQTHLITALSLDPLASDALFSRPCPSIRASFPLKNFGLLVRQTLLSSKSPFYTVLGSSSRESNESLNLWQPLKAYTKPLCPAVYLILLAGFWIPQV